MAKAKILSHEERIALTKGKFPHKTTTDTQHFDKCPMCGAMALVHEGGCEHCMQCGYDACGLH